MHHSLLLGFQQQAHKILIMMKPKYQIKPASVLAEQNRSWYFLQANVSGALFSIYLHVLSLLIILSCKHLSDTSKE